MRRNGRSVVVYRTEPYLLLFIVLLALKLTEAIDLSWVWVTLPLWWPLGVIALFGVAWFLLVIAVYTYYIVRDQLRKFNSKKRK